MRGVNDEMFPKPGTHAPTDAWREEQDRLDREHRLPVESRKPSMQESAAAILGHLARIDHRQREENAQRLYDQAVTLAELIRGLVPGTKLTITLEVPPESA